MPHWYYAKGDQQHGPVSEEEIKRLVAVGSIAPTDDVWRDGMEDWLPLSQVAEFAGERPLAPPVLPTHSRDGSARGVPAGLALLAQFNVLDSAKTVGPWLLVLGFILVVTAKGCDSIAARDAAQIRDDARTAQAEFDHEYDMRQARLEVEREAINEKTEILDRDQERLERIDELLLDLQKEREDQRRSLSRVTWKQLEHNAATAEANRLWWAYYHEVLFVFGSMVLVVGLIVVSATGDAPQRWLCLVMLAIITFSIFVGGFAWVGYLLDF